MDDNSPIGISVVSDIYNKKLQQEKLKLEEQKDATRRVTAARHQRMLEALVETRSALKEISSVELGDSFSFKLLCDDNWGWPRLTLKILSSLSLTKEPPQLIVTANDRSENGIIEFSFDKQKLLSLHHENSSAKVQTFLRQCLREFLDTATKFVLEVDSYIQYEIDEDSIEQRDILATKTKNENFLNQDLEQPIIDTYDNAKSSSTLNIGSFDFTSEE